MILAQHRSDARTVRSGSRWALALLVLLALLVGPPLAGLGGAAQAQPEGSVEQADKYVAICGLMAKNDQPKMALQACLMGLEIYQAELGRDHDKTRSAAALLVEILEQQGQTAEAAQVREHFLSPPSAPGPSAPQQIAEPAEPSRRQQMNEIAKASVEAKAAGDFDLAIEKYRELLGMLDEDGEDDSPIARKIRQELAYAYDRQMRYALAEPLLKKNLEQTEASGNPLALASARQDLALHYNVAGQYDLARPLYEQNLRDAEARDPESDEVVLALVQLAKLSESTGDHARARQYGERAHDLARERERAPLVPLLAETVLGRIYTTLGLYDRAEPLLRSALRRAEQEDDAASGRTGVLWALGWLYRAQGEYARAETYWRRELALEEQAEGPEGMGLSSVLNYLAELYWAWGEKRDRIMPLAHRASAIEDRKYAALLSGGSEQMKLSYVQRYVQGTDRVVTYHLHYARGDAQAARLALDTVLRRKGRVLDAVVDTMQELRQRASGGDRDKLEQIRSVRSQIATLTLGGKPAGMTHAAYRDKLAALEQRDQQLQSELGSAGAAFQAEQAPIGFEAVQQELPGGAALIEIIAYRKFDVHYRRPADAFGPQRYAAYVLRTAGKPQAVDLGPARAIDQQIAAFRKALATPDSTDVRERARALYDRVMAPVVPYVGDDRHLLVAPDGMLNLVPFGALADERGRYLVERYQFTYLASGRDLLALRSRGESQSGPLVVGNPSFDATGSGAPSGDDEHRGRRSVDFGKVRFPPLPGTAEEVAEIADLLDDTRLATEAEATESLLKSAHAPVVLHVATHGFFLADLAPARAASRGLELVDASLPVSSAPSQESPLVRSGLALAGANQHDDSGGEDGVLTALEVTGLDLYGTQLVVLSACETGVGEVRNGDGVYGLRRALVIAGAESQVMSLWKVDDEATRDLMIDYYEKLVDEEGRSAALRDVQRAMASSSDRAHPYYWAAFIASGRWDPMRFDVEEQTIASDDDDWDLDLDWTFEARQFADVRLDLIGRYITPDSYDGTFGLGVGVEVAPLVGDPDDIIGFAIDFGGNATFNTDAHLGLDTHLGVGPGFWLGPFALAPYIGVGMDFIGTRPDESEGEVVDTFIMDPAFYWYLGGRARFAISAFALEGYVVRTARGSITGDVAVDVPDQTRVVSRAVIQVDDESELSAGFLFTDYDAEALGAVGMGGIISYGGYMEEDW